MCTHGDNLGSKRTGDPTRAEQCTFMYQLYNISMTIDKCFEMFG